MRFLHIGLIIVAGLLGALIGILAFSTSTPNDLLTDEQFSDRVRETLVSDPEILRDAFRALETQTRQAEMTTLQDAITRNYSLIEDAPASVPGGNPDGDVTIIEFFDYECGFCRRALEPFQDLVESDGNIRVIFYELPILGERSYRASIAALAAQRQGLYQPFHDAAVARSDQLTDEVIFEIASEAGMDLDQLRSDLQDPSLTERIDANRQFAQALQVNSTPTYVVGGQVILGWNVERMVELVEEARAR